VNTQKAKEFPVSIPTAQPWLRSKRAIVIAGTVATTLSLAYAVPQVRSQWSQRREARAIEMLTVLETPYAAGDAAELRRQELVTILANLHEVSTLYGAGASARASEYHLEARTTAESAIDVVMGASLAELSLMIEHVPDLGELTRSTSRLLAIAREDAADSLAMSYGGNANAAPSPQGAAVNSHGFPGAPYSSEVGSVRPSTGALLAASATHETAEGVREVASRGCDQTVVAIGAGGNPSLACIATDAVYIVAKTAFWAIQFESDDVDSAEIAGSYLRLGHLHDDITFHDSDVRQMLNGHDEGIRDLVTETVSDHDANMAQIVSSHDENITEVVALHDAAISVQVADHDFNVRNELDGHDVAVRGELDVHDTFVRSALGQAQQTLDERVEQRKVALQAFMLWDQREYLVVCLESGSPINVSFVAIESYNRTQNAFVPCSAAQVVPAGTGIYKVILAPNGPVSSEVYRVRVRCNDGLEHFGQLVFSRSTRG
jgi:hypothetical protein